MASPCDIWVCDNCGQPNLIERDGFYEEVTEIKDGNHPEPEVTLECWVCGFNNFTRVTYVRIIDWLERTE
jgi:hypothetical protein